MSESGPPVTAADLLRDPVWQAIITSPPPPAPRTPQLVTPQDLLADPAWMQIITNPPPSRPRLPIRIVTAPPLPVALRNPAQPLPPTVPSAGVDRRKLLRFGIAAAGTLAATGAIASSTTLHSPDAPAPIEPPRATPPPVATEKPLRRPPEPEKSTKPGECRAQFLWSDFDFYDPGGKRPEVVRVDPNNTPLTKQEVEKLAQSFEVTGYGPKQATFLANSPFGPVIVNQKDAAIYTESSPLKEVRLKEGFGINLNEVDSLPQALELGASAVRIDLGEANSNDLAKYKVDIENAMKMGVKLNIIFRPTKLDADPAKKVKIITDSIDAVAGIIGGYKNLNIELGNEPDAGPFWEGHDLKTFAEFAKIASDHVMARFGKEVKIVMAALVEQGKTLDYLTELEKAGIKLSDMYFGFHAYQDVVDTAYRLTEITKVLQLKGIRQQGRIIATEIGCQDKNKANLPDMIQKLRENNVTETYIYTLVDPPSTSEHRGFGLTYTLASTTGVRPKSYGKMRDYYPIQQFSQTLRPTSPERTYNTLNKTIS